MNTHLIVPRIISSILSILDAADLRNRVYAMEQRVEILEVAISDIERINANSANPNALISGIVARVRKF